MGTNIGIKKSFWNLIEEGKNILIPEIQRDYTYGSETEETNMVLNNLLSGIKEALFDGAPEMTLNFVYGYTEKEKNFVPLDGQQRLTTLFLLHYYAAIFSGISDIQKIHQFSYATRETSKSYCNQLIENCADIKRCASDEGISISEAVKSMAWFIPSYENDPTIRSMQVVLKRIEEVFSEIKEKLWEKLTAEDCYVNFYLLDFGPFGLSDDLYVKMNSRGKKLTSFEIFKSLMLKHIEKNLGDIKLRREIAKKLDNSWTDLIWESIGRPESEADLQKIDESYWRLMIFCFNFISLKVKHVYSKTEQTFWDVLLDILKNIDSVKLLEEFFDVFYRTKTKYGTVEKGIESISCGFISNDLFDKSLKIELYNKNKESLYLIGVFYALRKNEEGVSKDRIKLNIRHMRNLIENSDDEIRKEHMSDMVNDLEMIFNITGVSDMSSSVAFNTKQWEEEREKEKNLGNWEKLWQYEDHEYLEGALSNFGTGNIFNLNDVTEFGKLVSRLEKFDYVFSDCKQNDKLIRAGLLCSDDYTQYYGSNSKYKIIGVVPSSWNLMLVSKRNRKKQDVIMQVIDRVKVSSLSSKQYLIDQINAFIQPSNVLDWRYYAIKYKEYTYVAYSAENYGYLYLESTSNPLTIIMLQSTQYGVSNVAWYMLNKILFERNQQTYNISLYTHACDESERNVYLCNELELGIAENGWLLKGIEYANAGTYGLINYSEVKDGKGDIIPNQIYLKPGVGEDYIEWAENNVLLPLSRMMKVLKR